MKFVESNGSDEKLIRKRQVADILGVSLRSVERLVSMGRLTRVRVMGAIRYRASVVQGIVKGGAQ